MEFEIISIRIILFVVMLGIAGIMDAKTRKIPDVLWLVFGGIGAILYIWDYETLTPYHHIAMILSGSVGLMVWRWRIAGIADSLAIIAMSVILPVHYEFVMMPILILVLSFFTVVFATVLYNVVLNSLDLVKKKRLFSEFKDESTYRKLFAFVSSHRKRNHEKYVIPTETLMSITPNVKSFRFLSSRNNAIRDGTIQSSETYVQNIPPLITFLFGISMLLLLPEILSMLFS